LEYNGEPMSHNVTTDSGNPFAPPLNDWRGERAPANINYCKLPSRSLVPTMHTHTAVSQLYIENVGYSFHISFQCNG
jgi:hypothetical protein